MKTSKTLNLQIKNELISNTKYNLLRQKLDKYDFLHSFDQFSYDLIQSMLNKYIESAERNKIIEENNKEIEEKANNTHILIEAIRKENSKLLSENKSIHLELSQIEAKYTKSVQAKEQEITRLSKEKEEMVYLRREYIKKIESLEKEIVQLKKRNNYLNSQIRNDYEKLNRSMISINSGKVEYDHINKIENNHIYDNDNNFNNVNNDKHIDNKLKEAHINTILSPYKTNTNQMINQIQDQEEEIRKLKNELKLKQIENEELNKEILNKNENKLNTNTNINKNKNDYNEYIPYLGSIIHISEIEKLISYLKSENSNLIVKSNHKEDFLMKKIIELEEENKKIKDVNKKMKQNSKYNYRSSNDFEKKDKKDYKELPTKINKNLNYKAINNEKDKEDNQKLNKNTNINTHNTNKTKTNSLSTNNKENNSNHSNHNNHIQNDDILKSELYESRESFMKLDKKNKEMSSIYNSEKTILNNKLIEINRELNKSEEENRILIKEIKYLKEEINCLRDEINIKSGVLFMKDAEIEKLKH